MIPVFPTPVGVFHTAAKRDGSGIGLPHARGGVSLNHDLGHAVTHFHLPSRPLNPQRFGLLQYGLYGFFLAIGRVLVFAQDALDHQAQLGAYAFAG